MNSESLKNAIAQADQAINGRDFERLMDFYAEDAILVVQPGVIARGRTEIRKAFIAISEYFNHSLEVKQGEMIFVENGDTALVLAKTSIHAPGKPESAFSSERDATYIYRRDSSGNWLCVIDNSYGTELLNQRTNY